MNLHNFYVASILGDYLATAGRFALFTLPIPGGQRDKKGYHGLGGPAKSIATPNHASRPSPYADANRLAVY
jgi:hypothetical protein